MLTPPNTRTHIATYARLSYDKTLAPGQRVIFHGLHLAGTPTTHQQAEKDAREAVRRYTTGRYTTLPRVTQLPDNDLYSHLCDIQEYFESKIREMNEADIIHSKPTTCVK